MWEISTNLFQEKKEKRRNLWRSFPKTLSKQEREGEREKGRERKKERNIPGHLAHYAEDYAFLTTFLERLRNVHSTGQRERERAKEGWENGDAPLLPLFVGTPSLGGRIRPFGSHVSLNVKKTLKKELISTDI